MGGSRQIIYPIEAVKGGYRTAECRYSFKPRSGYTSYGTQQRTVFPVLGGRKTKKRTSSNGFFSMLLFALGISIILYPYAAQYINNLSATRLVNEYFAAATEGTTVAPGGGDTAGKIGGLAGYNDTAEDIFGSIAIPKLKLELPIYVGTTTANLSKGIAHMEGTSLPVGGISTHSVLCGHNGSVTNEWFTHIDELTEGDLFYVRTTEQLLTYKVVAAKIIAPDDTSDLYIKEGKDLVTLLTCTQSGMMRLIVTGERVLAEGWTNG